MSIVDLKKIFMSLSYSDKKELLEILEHSNQIDSIREDIDESRFSEGIFCPHCGCTENIVKFGKYNSIQRYKCKNCNSTFSSLTKTVFARSQKPLSVWEKYIECMLDGLSISKSADICDISIPTAFIWRHKILDALSEYRKKNSKLKGVVESDSTFFRVSYKGTRKLPEGRKAYKRGTKASKRGLSNNQVCVECAIDRSNTLISGLCNLGKPSSDDLIKFYKDRVEEKAIFCTDSEKAYRKFASENGYELHQIESGSHKKGIYHINHVNAFHSNLKSFMRGFRGVSTKYLGNYLSWMGSLKMGILEVVRSVIMIPSFEGSSLGIFLRPAVPVA